MKVHIGNKIRETVKGKGLSVTDFAKKINYSRRNIYSIFSKNSIDTGLLNKIGGVLEHDFFREFSAGVERQETSNVEEPMEMFEYYRQKNRKYKEQVEALTKEVTYLKEINSLLKEQANKKQ